MSIYTLMCIFLLWIQFGHLECVKALLAVKDIDAVADEEIKSQLTEINERLTELSTQVSELNKRLT